MNVVPQNNGCWFCHQKDGDLNFCFEFDTYLHLECLELAALTDSNDEVQIMLCEFGLQY
jgi:hypothetical protein